jgi:catechol 2,3-dioxygenase
VEAPRDPEELEAAAAPVTAEIAADTRLGAVSLTVADLDRSLAYYEHAIGLRVVERQPGRASLGAGGAALLELDELPGARPADGYSGLFHFALLVPRRADLACWLAHAARERVPLTGASDHFVSEALYLRDPDHHGIEIYWDRPRELWEGQVNRMGTWPLDIQDVLAELGDPEEAFDGLSAGTTMGHVHLRVAEIESVVEFYRDVLGFALMAQLGPEAAFLSAGGYHHHVGANVWESRGAGQAPPGSATLAHWTVALPSEQERERVLTRAAAAGHDVGESATLADPSGNRVVLVAAEP